MHQVQNLTFHQEVNKQAMQIADYTYSYTSSSRYFVPHFCQGSPRNQAESLYKIFALESFNGVCPCRICCNDLIAK